MKRITRILLGLLRVHRVVILLWQGLAGPVERDLENLEKVFNQG